MNRPYSGFEHLAKSVLLSRWKQGRFVMLTAYFDESRTDDGMHHKYPLVSGFVSDVEMWIAFEKEWLANASKSPNKNKRKKQNRKNRLLAEIINAYTLAPVHAAMDKKLWTPLVAASAKSAIGKTALGQMWSSAYGVCAYVACQLLEKWGEDSKLRKGEKIRVVFDKGNPDRPSFERGFKAYQANQRDSLLYDEAAFEDDETVCPLAAADVYASHLSVLYEKEKITPSLRLLERDKTRYGGVLSESTIGKALKAMGRI